MATSAPSVSVSVGHAWGRWSLLGRGTHEFQRSTGGGAPGVAVRLSHGVLAFGPRFRIGKHDDIRAHVGVELGLARGRGFRVPSAGDDRVFWRAFSTGVMFAHVFERGVFLSIDADFRLALGEIRFVVEGGEDLHVLGPIAGSLRVGAGYRF